MPVISVIFDDYDDYNDDDCNGDGSIKHLF